MKLGTRYSELVHLAVFLAAFCVLAAPAWAQQGPNAPHLGYLYPAGGQAGSTFRITAGGQYLRGVSEVYVSGEGVRASVIQWVPPVRSLNADQRREIQRRLQAATQQRLAERGGRGLPVPAAPGRGARRGAAARVTTPTQPLELPNLPILENLETMSLRQLEHVRNELLNLQRKQTNPQIAESVVIEIAIDPRATPGDRELRLRAPAGLSNPIRFQVGWLHEAREEEVNDPDANPSYPPQPALDLPILLNGQIGPGDVDRFRLRARLGRRIVVDVQARRLMPYLADAVPGWFQATVALYDAEGREVAFADDFRFDPDPMLYYEIPRDGDYELEVRDAIYRGREDFVYRIAVGELPMATGVFPLGGTIDSPTPAQVAGWNLPQVSLSLDTRTASTGIRQMAVPRGWLPRPIPYSVDTWPEVNEAEANDDDARAQAIALPCVVNGRIARPGDVDVFRFAGRAGDELVAEVLARRLDSPLDSLVRLTDDAGRVIAWNDDHEDAEAGLLTHHADSYLRCRLPGDGVYHLRLSDTQNRGGEEYGYRLRLGPPQPDFALRATPSSLSIPLGGSAVVEIHALRKDGFDGAIEIALKDAPAGFSLQGGVVPARRDRVRMTLTASGSLGPRPVALRLEGTATIAGHTVTRAVIPCEELMQAFIYMHLVPSRELMAAARGGRGAPPATLMDTGPVRIPRGGTAAVRVRIPNRPALADIAFELSDPPAGLTLRSVTPTRGGAALLLKSDLEASAPGDADNLIVEVYRGGAGARRGAGAGGRAGRRGRASLGVLPAIPIEIVNR